MMRLLKTAAAATVLALLALGGTALAKGADGVVIHDQVQGPDHIARAEENAKGEGDGRTRHGYLRQWGGLFYRRD